MRRVNCIEFVEWYKMVLHFSVLVSEQLVGILYLPKFVETKNRYICNFAWSNEQQVLCNFVDTPRNFIIAYSIQFTRRMNIQFTGICCG